uniref:Uncharacterized protein n=1 Tax=Mucochytrium quahogii TaxID=96639 RepID=A0A7S2WRJ5_9STRA|mmetsp:Transcript_8934/g.14529  ORF Transcript_8934/g.14529 Transcript_8934/m.14529 type:complete len:163 (+) Transcript_8934:85-573(+)|eukprot:CAMPEP_0203746744 /NCGR_PEP_ID=MMETSP0098-20131031/2094_1 /ASSEMBLY_ACC=CAM_ASM_000208 /TAXON_ID=96639 /ORGANISM=" , Strain NY0313808BC1" /LENGTH=162 /DNA_ID=CAMNT_0050634947 /DNA_START=71 /DNA_END=559 /DNA_ORIENTATION=-
MFPYIVLGVAGINLLAAILAMALDWLTETVEGVTFGGNIWQLDFPDATLSTAKAFLVLSFVATGVTTLLCACAIMRKVSWIATAVGNFAAMVFSTISFAAFVSLDFTKVLPGVNYGAGFGLQVLVCVLGLLGTILAVMAYKQNESSTAQSQNQNANHQTNYK